ncbi:MAG: cysteine hydrolase [Acidimicrobiaceae bacterium]|nr:cysteine hydrolase [Acidimicrobiaceae bacterium]
MARALVVIDVQEEYFTGALRIFHPDPHISLSNIQRAMEAAAGTGVPVVLVRHTGIPEEGVFVPGTPGWDLRWEVAERPHDLLLDKEQASAFHGTDLAGWLAERSIDTVTLAGYMTQHCVDSTSRHAGILGLYPEILSDATGTLAFRTPAGQVTAEELHRATLVAQSIGFAQILTTEQWVELVRSAPQTSQSTV